MKLKLGVFLLTPHPNRGDSIDSYAPGQTETFFLGADSSAMVSDGIIILGTGWLAVIGSVGSHHFLLTKVANHNIQPIGNTQDLIFMEIFN